MVQFACTPEPPRSAHALIPHFLVSLETMSSADPEDILPEAAEPKTEDSNYEDPLDFAQDLDTEEKPDVDNEEPMSPQQDADMEDLFGDDKPAEEITHREGSVSKVLRDGQAYSAPGYNP